MRTKKLILTKVNLDLPGVTKQPLLFRGLFDGDELIEVNCEKESDSTPLNTICIGRVENIVPSMNGVFVRISADELAYLPIKEAKNALFSKKTSSKDICIGDEILVQVCKEPIKTKGATLTTSLQIDGKYVVLTTDTDSIQVSKKIIGDTRKRLKDIFSQLKTSFGEKINEIEYGIIVRTNAMYASREELESEYKCLFNAFSTIVQYGIHKSLYSVLYTPENAIIRRIRDFLSKDEVEIITDIPKLYETIKNSGALTEQLTLRLYEDNYSLDKLFSVSSNLEKALSSKVWLKSGAYILIEPTEALTVIDVNSGKNIKKKNSERFYLEINLEAAEEIFKQIQLRNISGIIIVDFIDVIKKEQLDELIDKLNDLCKQQRIPTSFVEMGKLNLANIIRKKVQQSLREQVQMD